MLSTTVPAPVFISLALLLLLENTPTYDTEVVLVPNVRVPAPKLTVFELSEEFKSPMVVLLPLGVLERSSVFDVDEKVTSP